MEKRATRSSTLGAREKAHAARATAPARSTKKKATPLAKRKGGSAAATTAAAPARARKKAAKKAAAAPKRARSKGDSPEAKLAKYRSMRDFALTAEPKGGAAPSDGHSFVIQKHAASHLHYDFRLEHAGVLLSWSVPKGPSLRANDRRLAVRTEDHPREYADFEGIIPKGEYGGGSVIVWDRGEWVPDGDAQKGLDKGHLAFDLHGQKLTGRFHLVKTQRGGAKQEHWLLFKSKDASADPNSDVVSERPESVLSGRTVEEVAAAPARVWHSNRSAAEQASEAFTLAEQSAKKRTPAAKNTRAKAAPTAASPKRAAPLDVASVVRRLPLPFALTNLDKVLYPAQDLKKADLLAYYAAVASYALPHLGGRPLTLVRCPNGFGSKCFFQKHVSEGVPPVVQRVDVKDPDKPSADPEVYMAVRDLEGLVALAQMGVLEVHTWVCHIDKLELPDQFVFDLDPDEGLGWDAVVEAAFLLRQRLADLELESFVKTTGGKGLHVVVPVARKLSWAQHYEFAKGFADSIAREQPQRYLTNMRKALRKGKLFVDYLRNGRGATAVAPYSTRARDGATVSTPISWQELEQGIDPRAFDLYSVIKRLDAKHEDPWRAYATTKQNISAKAMRKVGM